MDIKSDSQSIQAISDDQELAKVLAGVGQGDDANQDGESADTMLPAPPTPMPAAPVVDEPADEVPAIEPPVLPPAPEPDTFIPPTAPVVSTDDTGLDAIKQQALGELRPLVDKLNVSPEEKFDTYLLLLRSTDDKDLIAPAHEAAKSITDEAKRAQALLDIIKEIDFLSQSR